MTLYDIIIGFAIIKDGTRCDTVRKEEGFISLRRTGHSVIQKGRKRHYTIMKDGARRDTVRRNKVIYVPS